MMPKRTGAMTADRLYYEDPRLWLHERYETEAERRRLQQVARRIPSDTYTILDVGAGNGAFISLLEETTDLHVTGLEPSLAARAAAVCRSKIVDGSADDLPFPDRSFDVVTALEVLEHLPFSVYERALSELARVATTHVIVSVPYRERRLLVSCPYCGCRFHPFYHMRSFTRPSLASMVPGFDLEGVDLVHVDDKFGAALLRRLVRGLLPGTPPPASACPQCGKRGSAETASPTPRLGARRVVMRRLWAILPTQRRPKWAVARYRRRV
jgi:SAM-dependent methyltransferase